jgi:hypothetical protein
MEFQMDTFLEDVSELIENKRVCKYMVMNICDKTFHVAESDKGMFLSGVTIYTKDTDIFLKRYMLQTKHENEARKF